MWGNVTGGELIEFFKKEKARQTEELIKEQITVLLYNNGEGKMATRIDYLKWKYRDTPHVSQTTYQNKCIEKEGQESLTPFKEYTKHRESMLLIFPPIVSCSRIL